MVYKFQLTALFMIARLWTLSILRQDSTVVEKNDGWLRKKQDEKDYSHIFAHFLLFEYKLECRTLLLLN